MYSMRLHHVPMLASMCVNILGFVNSGGNAFFSNLFPVLQEVVFREDSEKNSLAQRSCFGVQGGCFLSSLSEGTHSPHPQAFLPPVCVCVSVCACVVLHGGNVGVFTCMCVTVWF